MADRDPLEGARVDRDYLLAHERWLSAEDVALALNAKLAGAQAENWAAKLRQDRQLFGVRFRGQYLHPEFQFGMTGTLLPKLGALLTLLPISDGNWNAAFWLFQPDGRFGGRRPVDAFAENTDAVVNAAREDFVAGSYEGDPVMAPAQKPQS